MRRPVALLTTLVAVALLGACTQDSKGSSPTTTELRIQPIAALVRFDACADYLDWIKAEALERVGPWGLFSGAGVTAYAEDAGFAVDDGPVRMEAQESAPASTIPPGTDGAARSSADETGTNNQEAGVDEADLVKTDGRRVVTVLDRRMLVIDITGVPTLAGTVDLGMYGQSLFLVGDRAFVLGTPDPDDVPAIQENAARTSWLYRERTRIVEVDLSGASPMVTDAVTIDGSLSAGRLSDGVVRLVVRSSQPVGLAFVSPQTSAAEAIATSQNRSVIESSDRDAWLPAVIGADGRRTPLVDCEDMFRPAEFSGFATLSLVSITDGLGSLDAIGLAADSGIVYASTESLYVATTRYPEVRADREPTAADLATSTDVHRFGIDRPRATYVASGRVEGTAINQYALSEHEGRLRIATTTDGTGWGGPRPMPMPMPTEDGPAIAPDATTASPEFEPSSSRVTILETRGRELAEVGKVVGLGPTERIQGVRFEGDRGYVVTFRQTDPLYVLDLSDPTAPEVLGELKVTGFSDYLHPVGDGLMLGAGVEATEEGRTTGAKIALYDTTDPTNPLEIDRLVIPGGWLSAGSDPHAFTWDPERSQASIIGTWYDQGQSGSGAIVVRVEGRRLVEVGRLVHDPDAAHAPSQPGPDAPGDEAAPTTTTEAPATTVPDRGSTTTEAPPTTVVAPPTTIFDDGNEGEGRSGSGGGTAETPPGDDEVTIEPVPPTAGRDMVDRWGQRYPDLLRTFVVGGRLWALSYVALSGHDPVTLAETAWVPFP